MDNIFVIPNKKNSFIIYLPLLGILFEGNKALVNLFYDALRGDKKAQQNLDLNEKTVEKIVNSSFPDPQNNGEWKFKPTAVSLFLTTNCSMRCVYCYADAGVKSIIIKHEYAKVAIEEIIKNAKSLNKKTIIINYHGGGDLGVIWTYVKELTGYIQKRAKENNLEFRINAGLNGILNKTQQQWVVDNISSATISLDGTKEIQNKLRPLKNGQPSFEKVNDTLKYFDSKNFNYAIRTTITSETIEELEDSIEFFCKNYNVKKIKVEPVFFQGRATTNNVAMPKPEKFVEHFIKSREIARSYNKQLLYSGLRFNTVSNIFCQASGNSFGVTPNGTITSCYEVLDESDFASDIFFYGKIENNKINIDDKKLENLRNLNVTNKEKCKKCFAKYHCAGDCPVKSILSEKDVSLYNYRCAINRELTKQEIISILE